MNQKLIKLWLILGIIIGFASIIFFSLNYLNHEVLCDLQCSGKSEVQIVLVMLSLIGLFVGSLTYYFISDKYIKEITKIQKDIRVVYNFLETDERLIIKSLVDAGGKLLQSKLVKETKLSRVKLSRELKKLEDKGIILKKKSGMTNSIELSLDIQNLFIQKQTSTV